MFKDFLKAVLLIAVISTVIGMQSCSQHGVYLSTSYTDAKAQVCLNVDSPNVQAQKLIGILSKKATGIITINGHTYNWR